jgi:hypothetical protein
MKACRCRGGRRSTTTSSPFTVYRLRSDG